MISILTGRTHHGNFYVTIYQIWFLQINVMSGFKVMNILYHTRRMKYCRIFQFYENILYSCIIGKIFSVNVEITIYPDTDVKMFWRSHFTLIKSIILETSWCDQKQNSLNETGTPFSRSISSQAIMLTSNDDNGLIIISYKKTTRLFGWNDVTLEIYVPFLLRH